MPFDITPVFTVVGEIIGIGVPTGGAVYLGSKWLIEKWMDHQFAERLAELRKEHDAALKHIQSSIDHQIHRAKKLYDTEFDVLTKSWNMLEELYGHVVDTSRTAPIFTEWDTATKDEIRAVLDTAEPEFSDEDKRQVVDAEDPSDEYRVVYNYRRAFVYEAASKEFGHYLGSNGIFMRPEIRERFKRLSLLITLVFSEFASNIRRARPAHTHFMTLNTEGKVLRDELRNLIEGRLWSAADTHEDQSTGSRAS